jgi:hypothetical protein
MDGELASEDNGKLTLSWMKAHNLSMRRTALSTFLFVAALGWLSGKTN